MSAHTYVNQDQSVEVHLGYDRPLDYVFCTVFRKGDMVYSNLDDRLAGTKQQDVEYYRPILARFGITLPEKMFVEVKHDQRTQAGNRVVHYSEKEKASENS